MGDAMREIGVGLLGFGTIGAGVVQGLQDNGDLMTERLGARPVIRAIADLDLETDRGVSVDPAILTTDAVSVVNNPEVDIVIELIGGTTIALDLVIQALNAGKSVVTANKALLAKCGAEIYAAAGENNVDIYFGASVGGGIPIIKVLREGLVGNKIEGMYAILNGTCNYILTRMESDGAPFDDVLAEAQEKGYAEADPSLDIDGYDTAHKAVILASLAYGTLLPHDAVEVEGIRGIAPEDIAFARDLGYRIKLLAVIKRDNGEVEIRVHPALVDKEHVLASINGVFNGVAVQGDYLGDALYYGRGAGREPTASTVLSDVGDIVRNIVSGSVGRVPAITLAETPVTVKPLSDVVTRYYLRMSVADEAGVMARITSAFGKRNISIAAALQKGDGVNGYVPVVYMTHEARERDIRQALAEIGAMDVVETPPVVLRIEG